MIAYSVTRRLLVRKGLQIAKLDETQQGDLFNSIFEAKDQDKSQVEGLVSRKLTAAGVNTDKRGKKKQEKMEDIQFRNLEDEMPKRKSVAPVLFATQPDASAVLAKKRKKPSAKKLDTGI